MKYYCPNCKKSVIRNDSLQKNNSEQNTANQFFPFCSLRCKLLDIGQWFDESYRIPAAENTDEEED